jgi:hypothetical protein
MGEIRGTPNGVARCTQPSVPSKAPGHCELGPEAHCQVQNGEARARARYRTTATVMAGGVLRARASDQVHSTQDSRAHHKTAATPIFGHRRRAQHQWRAAEYYRKTRRRQTRTKTTFPDAIERGKGSVRCAGSPRTRGDCRRRTGRAAVAGIEDEGHAVVLAVKRQRRRGDGIPARVARRGRRGGPGAPFCHGDSSTEARSDGNGAATASSDAVGIRVRVCGRLRASERGKRPGEERGGPWGPYPRARRLGVDGIGVGRGWSDRLGRYRPRGGR